jgi:hypothetical protein
MKAMVVTILAPIVGLAVPEHGAFWTVGTLAALLGIFKAPILIQALHNPETAAAFTKSRHGSIGGSVLLSCFVGTAALVAWLFTLLPLNDLLPEAGLHDYVSLGGFLAGLIFHPH